VLVIYLPIGLVLLLFLSLIVQAIAPEADPGTGALCLGSSLILIAGFIVAIIHRARAVRLTDINDRWVTLANVSDEFAEAVAAQREADERIRRDRISKFDSDPIPDDSDSTDHDP
jgi:hypothetical protein